MKDINQNSSFKEALKNRRASNVLAAMNFMKLDNNTLNKSLDYWSRHNPILMADEIFQESRGAYERKSDFTIALISYGIGLGTMWRFPYICVKHGCGSFIVIYTFFVITIAIPLSLLETSLAQFSSTGATKCWRFCPGLKGIGCSMLLISLFGSFYYNLVLAWCLFYTINSLRIKIPFLDCENFWNNDECMSLFESNFSPNETRTQTSAQQFWYNYVTTQYSDNGRVVRTIDSSPESLVWYTASCIIIVWSITAVILMKGIKISNKKIFISIFFPYSVLLLILIITFQLPGSLNGISMLIKPTKEQLFKPSTWLAALEQIFFSFGIGFGGIITLGSYNRFHFNIQRDTIIICAINYFTSLVSGFISFMILGYMAQKYSTSIFSLVYYADQGFVFIIFPESFAYFSYPQITNTLYFLTLLILGFDSLLIMMETVITGLIDIIPILNDTQYHRIFFVFMLHLVCSIFSLIFVTKTGYNLFNILSTFILCFNLLIVGFTESVGVSFLYKLSRLYRDCKMMVPNSIFSVWKLSFILIIPISTMLLSAYGFFTHGPAFSGRGIGILPFPIWADVIGWILLMLTILPIPFFFICYFCYSKLSMNLSIKMAFIQCISPDIKWGPMKRKKWLLDEYYKKKLAILKEDAEILMEDSSRSITNAKLQWYKRLNLLSDSNVEIRISDSRSFSKDSDEDLSIIPFQS